MSSVFLLKLNEFHVDINLSPVSYFQIFADNQSTTISTKWNAHSRRRFIQIKLRCLTIDTISAFVMNVQKSKMVNESCFTLNFRKTGPFSTLKENHSHYTKKK